MAATGRYSNIKFPDLSNSTIDSEPWNDDILTSKTTYKIDLGRGKPELVRIAKRVVSGIKNSSVYDDISKEILILAHQLKDNVRQEINMLTENYEDGQLDLDYSSESVEKLSSVKKKTIEKVLITRDATEEEKKLDAEGLKKLGLELDPFKEGVVNYYEEKEVETEGETSEYATADFSDNEMKFIYFMACFITKIISKGDENLVNSWEHMKTNFEKFYSKAVSMKTLKSPSRKFFEEIKSQLHIDTALTRTILRMVVFLERNVSQEKSQAGMIRYLFIMPLSYTGMHSYKMFMALQKASGLGYNDILNALAHPVNNAALDCIANILLKMAPTTSDKRMFSFKYARLAGPQYFPEIQTKSCPALVYCLAMLLKKFESNSKKNYKPENIVGIRDLGTDIKTVMERASDLIFMNVPKNDTNNYSEYMMQAQGLKKGDGNVQDNKGGLPENPFYV
nr:TPA_asm: N [Cucurbita betacytorhabdovirus 1]